MKEHAYQFRPLPHLILKMCNYFRKKNGMFSNNFGRGILGFFTCATGSQYAKNLLYKIDFTQILA